MAEVDFYKLERPVQDRFADATREIGVPSPVIRVPPRRLGRWLWMGAGIGALAILAVVAFIGYADLKSRIAIAPPFMIAVYGLLAAVGVYCLLKGIGAWRLAASCPYEPGLYLFPIGIVDARREPFLVHRITDLTGSEVVESSGDLRVTVKDAPPVVFDIGDSAKAVEARNVLNEAQSLYEKAVTLDNRREQAQLDPLIDSGFSSPFSPKLPLRKRVPIWLKLAIPISVLVGGVFGAGIWYMRNVASEERLYAIAKAADDVQSYRAYLARKGPRPEVRDILLPRAELNEARKKGTVEAIEEYIAEHPNSRIQDEVDAALREALEAELQRAIAKGTVKALRAFAERRKKYEFIQPLVAKAVQNRYDAVFADFAKRASEGPPREFVKKLLEYAQTHGPTVHIQFIRKTNESLKNADSQVRRSAYFMGNQSLPSQYFKAEHAAAREAAAAEELRSALQKQFPEEILDFEIVPAKTGVEADDELPEPERPTLFIERTPSLAGGYMSTKPRGVFLGVGMQLTATFVIPGSDQRLRYKSSSWKRPNLQLLRKEDGATVADVYGEMASVGYERITKGFLEYFLGSQG